MGENLNLMQALYVTISSMAMVFLILLVISGILSLFKHIFKNENTVKIPNVNDTSKNTVNNIKNDSVQENFNIDEEEKIVVALAASIMAGDGIPNPNLHIKRITRIS
ncbi:OadG family protein [Romboutsia timonensis]|uniref:OadG family protein n=1 Tax=Romboutsia timonensis TaxID=1776391 RepID=UPI003990B929